MIARSYVPPQCVVDMHLFLLFQADSIDDDQAAAIDRLERDESICRKQVFVPRVNTAEAFEAFVDRTFLARPWAEQRPRTRGFQLDQPAAVVREILERQGLAPVAAEAWVRIADAYRSGEIAAPSELVRDLVAAMDESHV
ncbi:hypothetical protein CK219_16100 [Mesorhizobium sp. WSM4313]|nr:hypothetical protein CK219_16100 [Mesorhizobium sp. WSM4313]